MRTKYPSAVTPPAALPVAAVILLFCLGFVPQLHAAGLPDTIDIQVPRPNGEGDGSDLVTLELVKHSIRDKRFFKLFRDQQKYRRAGDARGADHRNFEEITVDDARFPVRTYRGYVREQPNSTVTAAIWPGDDRMSVYVAEGKRILWTVDMLPIAIDETGTAARYTVSHRKAAKLSGIDRRSRDWIPTFGTSPVDPASKPAATIDRSTGHGWSMVPDLSNGLKQVQVAVDAEPEWFVKNARGSLEWAVAIVENAVNMLDLVYVRDLGMTHSLTAIVIRDDTDLHQNARDTFTTWIDNGLGDNPGSERTSTETNTSIPFQQLILAYVKEGNPFAFRSKRPLDGGNFSRVPLDTRVPAGLSHEVGHNWGGAHFVYPRDSMSGGGPWFGPTTVQRMIFLRDHEDVGADLPDLPADRYGWNVHPYAMPDLARTGIDQSVDINVFGNDFDGNDDSLFLVSFTNGVRGGSVTLVDGKLRYHPPKAFRGRDTFAYIISDGKLRNDTWVQVDVGDGELILRYPFDDPGMPLGDVSGSGFDASAVNFPGSVQLTAGVSGSALGFPSLMKHSDAHLPDTQSDDSTRPFLSFGDVTDPFNGSHSVSLWVNIDPLALHFDLPVYLLANSSSVIQQLVSGYTIHTDTGGSSIQFELREQLMPDHDTELPPLRTLSYSPPGGIKGGAWYHLVLVVDRKTDRLRAYVNGEELQAAAADVALTTGSFIKGKPNGGRYISAGLGINTYKPKKYGPFVGEMDEFRVYSRALTPQEVQMLYEHPAVSLPQD